MSLLKSSQLINFIKHKMIYDENKKENDTEVLSKPW